MFGGSGLESFSWPSQLTTIPSYTFSGCVSLQRITIPATDDTSVYDLQGRKVTLPQRPSGGMQRGVYIDRGKKVVVK